MNPLYALASLLAAASSHVVKSAEPKKRQKQTAFEHPLDKPWQRQQKLYSNSVKFARKKSSH